MVSSFSFFFFLLTAREEEKEEEEVGAEFDYKLMFASLLYYVLLG